MHKHGRVDANQKDIVDALRKAGRAVWITSDLGNGFPDLIVAVPHKGTCVMECKEHGKKLTKREREFFDTWTGWKEIVYSPEDALRVTGAI